MTRWALRIPLAAGAVVLGSAATLACHSESYAIPFYGATGALDSVSLERLTYSLGSVHCPGVYCVPFRAYAPTWSQDGRGILYSFSPRPPQPHDIMHLACVGAATCILVASDPADRCLAMLPSIGGSAYWNICEEDHNHSAITDIFAAPSLRTSGQLFYTETSTSNDFPPRTTSAYWRVDTAARTERHQLTESDGINPSFVTETAWLDNQTILVAGSGALDRGVIHGDAIDFTRISTPMDVAAFSVIAGGTAVMTVDGSDTITRIELASGHGTTVATLPAGEIATDIGCHPDRCAVLSSNNGMWTVWDVDLASGQSMAVYSTADTIWSAVLSPTSSDIVLQQGDQLYLLRDAVH